MHGSLDKSGESEGRIHRNWGVLYVVPVLLAVAVIGMVIAYPAASTWISQAAQAEFVGSDLVPDTAPTQLAKPAMEIRTIWAN